MRFSKKLKKSKIKREEEESKRGIKIRRRRRRRRRSHRGCKIVSNPVFLFFSLFLSFFVFLSSHSSFLRRLRAAADRAALTHAPAACRARVRRQPPAAAACGPAAPAARRAPPVSAQPLAGACCWQTGGRATSCARGRECASTVAGRGAAARECGRDGGRALLRVRRRACGRRSCLCFLGAFSSEKLSLDEEEEQVPKTKGRRVERRVSVRETSDRP